MLSISFSGWAQCRLATDPDPYDEPRGVSGYMQAYAGEPNLDRIIRFQSPPLPRSHTQAIGVRVDRVQHNNSVVSDHPLMGVAIDLLGKPVFEGRNGVISEDGLEPVIPFHMAFQKSGHYFSRATMPTNPNSPYREFNASGVKVDSGLIQRATGITSLTDVWSDRLTKLKSEELSTVEVDRPALLERIEFLERNLASGGGVARFFAARMEWDYQLRSAIDESHDGTKTLLVNFTPTVDPWRVAFWFGGWDADAQAFYVTCILEIQSSSVKLPDVVAIRPERMSDVDRV